MHVPAPHELGIYGIFALLVIKEAFAFALKMKAKRNNNPGNPNSGNTIKDVRGDQKRILDILGRIEVTLATLLERTDK